MRLKKRGEGAPFLYHAFSSYKNQETEMLPLPYIQSQWQRKSKEAGHFPVRQYRWA